jgi:hypothetical protein
MATTYSFVDNLAGIAGPGISLSFNSGSGVADEGISVTMMEDKNNMVVGADGGGIHSLHAGNAGTVTIRLFKTNPINAALSAAYNYQKSTAALWGSNVIHIANPSRGDSVVCSDCAFRRQPDYQNAKDGGVVEWVFDTLFVSEILGDGTPNAA